MTANAWIQLLLYLAVLLAAVKPLGWYMARVYQGKPCGLEPVLGWFERLLYRLSGVNPEREMGWKTYTLAVLLFNLVGLVFLYVLLRLQGVLPLNPQKFSAVSPDSGFQHRRQLRHQHELAELRRRDHDELPLARCSGWPCRTSSRRRPAWPSSSP